MKKFIMIVVMVFSLLLSGCSLLEGANNSLEYANKAMEHITMWNEFGEEAPQLIKDAATNPAAKEELEGKLNALLTEIDEFNQTKPPTIAEGVHQQIVEKNEALKETIESVMVNGDIALEQLQDSPLLELISELTTLKNLVDKLGL
jgi:hypothetical protein